MRAIEILKKEYNNNVTLKGYSWGLVNNQWLFPFNSRYFSSSANGLPCGVCEDKSVNFVRVLLKNEGGKIAKSKPGKMLRFIINETMPGVFAECEINALCERFAEEWRAYAFKFCGKYTLRIGCEPEDFERIYTRSNYEGGESFSSCMENDGFHSFYNHVDASAAWLENDNGEIIARCIIYTRVRGCKGESYRLAERQYARCDSDRRALVNALIEGGHIDGYKKIGAGCSDACAFVDINGEDLPGCEYLYIKLYCFDPEKDLTSYQDSFKYLNGEYACNNRDISHEYQLDVTIGYAESVLTEWCEYTEERCEEVAQAYINGRPISVNVDFLDDNTFIKVGGEWHHVDDVYYCNECGEPFICNDRGNNGYYCALDANDYCCEECARGVYEAAGWFFDEYCREWRSPEDVKEYGIYNVFRYIDGRRHHSYTVGRPSAKWLKQCGKNSFIALY